MKNLKHWVAMLLMLAMLLSLCACGEDEAAAKKKEILGTWEAKVPCAELLETTLQTMGMECDIDDATELILYMEFKEDGTYTVTVDEDSAYAMVDAMLDAVKAIMPELLYAQFQTTYGWDKATTDAQLAAQGASMDQLVEESMAEMDSGSLDMSEDFENSAYYAIVDNTICCADTPEDLKAGTYTEITEYTINGDVMQFLSSEIKNEEVSSLQDLIEFPLTLNRVEN